MELAPVSKTIQPAVDRSAKGILSQLEPPAGAVDFSKVIAQRLQDVLSAADIQ